MVGRAQRGPALLVAGTALLLLGTLVADSATEGRKLSGASIETGPGSGSGEMSVDVAMCGLRGFQGSPDGTMTPLVDDCLAFVALDHVHVRIRLLSDQPVTLGVMSAVDYGNWVLGGPLNTTLTLARNVTSWDADWSPPSQGLRWPAPYGDGAVPPHLQRLEQRTRLSATSGYLVLLPGDEVPRQLHFQVLQEHPGARAAGLLALALLGLGALLVLAGIVVARRGPVPGQAQSEEPGPLETMRALVDQIDRFLVYRQLVPMAVAVLVLVPVGLTLFKFAAMTSVEGYGGTALFDPSPAATPLALLVPLVALPALVAAWWVLLREAGGRVDRWRAKLARFRAEEEDLLERL